MKVAAAVCTAFDKPLERLTLTLKARPAPGQVLVRLGASGVCHTDQSLRGGAVPIRLPILLGHEGAGTVEDIGEDVTRVRPGEHVVLSWIPQCGTCFYCLRGQHQLCEAAAAVVPTGPSPFVLDGASVDALAGLGTFAEVLVVPETAVVPIPDDIPLTTAALIGCAVMTGFGAARRSASIERGDTVVVVGAGGIGLNIVAGARASGAGQVVAVDIHEGNLALAERFGATDVVVPDDPGSVVAQIIEMTGGRGADVVFEAVGGVGTSGQALSMTRPGGQTCMVGMAAANARLPLSLHKEFVQNEKRILGSRYGSSYLLRDVPEVVAYYREGRLPLDELVTRILPPEKIERAFDALSGNEGGRSVIDYTRD